MVREEWRRNRHKHHRGALEELRHSGSYRGRGDGTSPLAYERSALGPHSAFYPIRRRQKRFTGSAPGYGGGKNGASGSLSPSGTRRAEGEHRERGSILELAGRTCPS